MKLQILILFSSLIGLSIGAGGSVGGSSGSSSIGSPTETENTRLFKKDHSLLLTCDYNATNVETIWKKNGTEIKPNDHYQIYNNSTLNITSQSESDLGEFSCLIKGPVEEEKYFYLVDLQLHKHLPKSTTVLENDKLKLSCLVEGNPHPNVQWLKDGEPLQPEENNTRLVFSANTYNVSNAILLIQPILKSDYGNYVCLISQYSLHLNTTTEVRVKDIYAALWPFLGIVAEVTILCAIIFIYEKRRIKPNLAQSDLDDINEQKNNADHSNETEVRQRK